jgi:hypothetical protein
MKIETKFNLGDIIHFLIKGKAYSAQVVRIDTETSNIHQPNEFSYKCWVRVNDKFEIINDKDCFSTQEQLVDSIISDIKPPKINEETPQKHLHNQLK